MQNSLTLSKEEVDRVVEAFAEKISSKSLATLKVGKEAFYRQREMDLEEAYDYCSQVMVENMLYRDAEEGITAFLEKRKAEWKDE